MYGVLGNYNKATQTYKVIGISYFNNENAICFNGNKVIKTSSKIVAFDSMKAHCIDKHNRIYSVKSYNLKNISF